MDKDVLDVISSITDVAKDKIALVPPKVVKSMHDPASYFFFNLTNNKLLCETNKFMRYRQFF